MRHGLRPATVTRSAALGVAVTAILAGAAGCGAPADLPIRPGSNYAPSGWPSAWPDQAAGLVVVNESVWQSDDAAIGSCSRSSIYAVRSDSASVLRRGWGKQACMARIDRDHIRGRPDGTEAILESEGRLARWQFAKGLMLEVPIPGGIGPRLPAWMPDGKSIVFVAASWGQSSGGDAVLAVPPSGGEPRQVFSVPDRRVVSAPSSDPEQRRMVVATRRATADSDSGPPEIVMLGPTGLASGILAKGYDPSWSPTGEWIAYIARSRTNVTRPAVSSGDGDPETFFGELRIIRPDGMDDHVLAQG